MAETMVKTPQRIQVPRDTADATQMPAAGLAATICRSAISRNTTECTSATTARLRLVRMENPSMRGFTLREWRTSGCDPDHAAANPGCPKMVLHGETVCGKPGEPSGRP